MQLFFIKVTTILSLVNLLTKFTKKKKCNILEVHEVLTFLRFVQVYDVYKSQTVENCQADYLGLEPYTKTWTFHIAIFTQHKMWLNFSKCLWLLS